MLTAKSVNKDHLVEFLPNDPLVIIEMTPNIDVTPVFACTLDGVTELLKSAADQSPAQSFFHLKIIRQN